DNLFLSISTVKKHIENIYTKLQAHNRIEALQKAKQNKLL
nr:response regulator transcription factor [Flavobacterium sp.]